MMQTQCWICPKCFNDHSENAPCSPPNNNPFSPSDDDVTLIAREYRNLVKEIAQLKAERDYLKSDRDAWENEAKKDLEVIYKLRDELSSLKETVIPLIQERDKLQAMVDAARDLASAVEGLDKQKKLWTRPLREALFSLDAWREGNK